MIGILLAGGRARRLGGGDKGTHLVGGISILGRVVAALRPQCSSLILNANGDPTRFAAYGLPVVPDGVADQPGPLAGLLAGLDYAAATDPDAQFAVSVPADTPFLPADLVSRLASTQELSGASVVCAYSAGHCHPTAAIWRIDIRHDLKRALLGEDVRKVAGFVKRHSSASVEWAAENHDPFFNINTPDDLEAARKIAAAFASMT